MAVVSVTCAVLAAAGMYLMGTAVLAVFAVLARLLGVNEVIHLARKVYSGR